MTLEIATIEFEDAEAGRNCVADQFVLFREKLNSGGWSRQDLHSMKDPRELLVDVTRANYSNL